MISQQTTNNKIAIPTIHFIELTARDDVRIFEIEQAVVLILPSSPKPAILLERYSTRTVQCFCSSLKAGGVGKSAGRNRTGSWSVLVSVRLSHFVIVRVKSSQLAEMYRRMSVRGWEPSAARGV